MQLNHVADRRRASGDTRPAVPDYTTLDVALRTQKLVNHWEFALALRNLFDADVRQPSLYSAVPPARQDLPTSQIPGDLPMAGRSAQLQATYRF